MRRALIDRMADTAVFRLLLFLSGLVVLPMLLAGVVISAFYVRDWEWKSEPALLAIPVLSAGGVIGMVGWLRARSGADTPKEHNVGLTLVCMAVGVATALAMMVAAVAETIDGLPDPFGSDWPLALPTAALVAAHAVWIVSGIAWMERLTQSYELHVGRAFDVLPILLLLIVLGLLIAAGLVGATQF